MAEEEPEISGFLWAMIEEKEGIAPEFLKKYVLVFFLNVNDFQQETKTL